MENNIHQIWVGDKRIPTHIKDYMNKVKEHHKDFNYYLWTDENLPELPAHLKEIYDSYKEPAIKADLLRMYVVHELGGVYLDADFDTIDGLYSDVMLGLNHNGLIFFNQSYGLPALANTIFGFKKNDPLLKYMIDNITHKNQWIGPNWWSQIICKSLGLDPDKSTLEELKEKLKLLDIEVIIWKDMEDHCFRHEALASWVDGSDWNEKLKSGDYD
jgi:mannosyltransferase OCH1-like enzyme